MDSNLVAFPSSELMKNAAAFIRESADRGDCERRAIYVLAQMEAKLMEQGVSLGAKRTYRRTFLRRASS